MEHYEHFSKQKADTIKTLRNYRYCDKNNSTSVVHTQQTHTVFSMYLFIVPELQTGLEMLSYTSWRF